MVDKKNQPIRKGMFVRYNGQIYKVSYVFFRTIILNNGKDRLALKVPNLSYPVQNLEVVFQKPKDGLLN